MFIRPCHHQMRRLGLLLAGCSVAALSHAAGVGAGAFDFPRQIEPLLETYCFDCHGDGADKGNLALDDYRTNRAFLSDTTPWLAVWRKLDSGLMPPPRKSQPSAAERQLLQDWIVREVFALNPNQPDPGRVTLRRLNRTEYEHTVRDWLGVDYDTTENFPADDTGYGFDNVGDVLTISPLLTEKYLDAAADITTALLEKVRPKIPARYLGGDRFREAAPRDRNARHLALARAATTFQERSVEHPGRYRLTVEFRVTGSQDATTETARLLLLAWTNQLGEQSLGWDNRQRITLTAETELTRGPHQFGLQLVPGNPPLEGENHLTLVVNHVRLEGPLDGSQLEYPPEHRRLFPDGPPPSDAAQRKIYTRKILRPLAERAFRQPVDDPTLERLVDLATNADQQEGISFEQSIGQALTALLASPRFLFRVEPRPAAVKSGSTAPVDEFALATRLSYFLWSSLPDDALLALARTNGLRANLDAQVNRLLADPRATRFVESFVGQWLQTRDVDQVTPDPKRILGLKSYNDPGAFFKDQLRRAMRQETELGFADLLRRGGTLGDLLTARETFLNEPLATFYGVPGVTGGEMRKVSLPADSPRGGLLTHGSFLLVTSNPTRTSPVKRGQFILENLLGAPAPPPPPDIPELEAAKKAADKTATMRELMAIHREKPLCASCHERMDAPGLALENFNALGGYRETENGQPIDTAGALVTGETFQGPGELARVLTTARRRDLYRCVTEKLLTYATGRGMEYYDLPTINQIVAKLEEEDGRLITLVREVIHSAPFQLTRVAPVRQASAAKPNP